MFYFQRKNWLIMFILLILITPKLKIKNHKDNKWDQRGIYCLICFWILSLWINLEEFLDWSRIGSFKFWHHILWIKSLLASKNCLLTILHWITEKLLIYSMDSTLGMQKREIYLGSLVYILTIYQTNQEKSYSPFNFSWFH